MLASRARRRGRAPGSGAGALDPVGGRRAGRRGVLGRARFLFGGGRCRGGGDQPLGGGEGRVEIAFGRPVEHAVGVRCGRRFGLRRSFGAGHGQPRTGAMGALHLAPPGPERLGGDLVAGATVRARNDGHGEAGRKHVAKLDAAG